MFWCLFNLRDVTNLFNEWTNSTAIAGDYLHKSDRDLWKELVDKCVCYTCHIATDRNRNMKVLGFIKLFSLITISRYYWHWMCINDFWVIFVCSNLVASRKLFQEIQSDLVKMTYSVSIHYQSQQIWSSWLNIS